MRADVRKRVKREHYPAPYAIVDLWERYGARGEQAFRAEAESIGKLLVTRTCRNLVHVFELRERLRNLAPKDSRVSRVHVVGAGTMGGDIAAWCALKGLDVTLQDRAQQYRRAGVGARGRAVSQTFACARRGRGRRGTFARRSRGSGRSVPRIW